MPSRRNRVSDRAFSACRGRVQAVLPRARQGSPLRCQIVCKRLKHKVTVFERVPFFLLTFYVFASKTFCKYSKSFCHVPAWNSAENSRLSSNFGSTHAILVLLKNTQYRVSLLHLMCLTNLWRGSDFGLQMGFLVSERRDTGLEMGTNPRGMARKTG